MKNINWKEIVIGLVIAIVSSLFLMYRIEDQYMWTDEVYSYEAAEIIADTGESVLPAGLLYNRASFYHKTMALSMRVFGKTTFASRIINIPFILGTMLLIYLFLRKRNKWVGMSASLLYLTTNFTIALARETRMYAVTTFFLVLTAYAFYKGFIEVKDGVVIKIKELKYKINIPYMVVALISTYLMYQTQPLTLMFGFGLITFYMMKIILDRKREDIPVLIGLIIFALIGLYYRYGTLHPVDLYFAMSPDWASKYPPAIPYYSAILAINIPWAFLFSPIVLYMIGKKKEKKIIYLFSIFFTVLFVLSTLQAQTERYIVPIIPFLITMTVYSLYEFYSILKTKKLKNIFLGLVIPLILIPQGIYMVKELGEIDSKTRFSINTFKKFEFNAVEEYLEENMEENDYLIGDFHSIYTLYWMNFDVDYFLLPEDDIHWIWEGREKYFGIPLMNYERDLENFVNRVNDEGSTVYLVIRDEFLFKGLKKLYTPVEEFERPLVFEIQ